MSTSSQILRPRFLFDGETLHRNGRVVVEGDRILEAGPGHHDDSGEWPVALLPGFVNAHSHAFQRGLRGKGESFLSGAGSFFTWREAMYDLVDQLDPQLAYDLSRQAFEEMLDSGFTSVGEFHYIHHSAVEPWSLDEAVIRAASDSGIRLVLLYADYVQGGFDQPLEGGQKRFDTGDPSEFLNRLDGIAERLRDADQSLGVVGHSIRALPIERMVMMREAARSRSLVFHLHLEEVRAEIRDCQEAHGCTPMRLLLDHGVIDERTTAVHCTHSTPEDLAGFAQAGGIVCLCPMTEGNLGDGISDLPGMRKLGCRVTIGTDLNSRISPLEELRWMEYVQRLSGELRGVNVHARGRTGPALMRSGSLSGAESLGIDAGLISKGRLADFTAIDLAHPTLRHVDSEDLLEAIVLGTGNEAVVGTCVGGRWLRGGPPEGH